MQTTVKMKHLKQSPTKVRFVLKDINGDSRDASYDIGAYEWHCVGANGGTIVGSSAICPGGFADLSVLDFEAQTFKWQSSTDNSTFSDIPNIDKDMYRSSALSSTMWYRVSAECSGTSAYSSVFNLGVNGQSSAPTPSISVAEISGTSNDNILCEGGEATLAVST